MRLTLLILHFILLAFLFQNCAEEKLESMDSKINNDDNNTALISDTFPGYTSTVIRNFNLIDQNKIVIDIIDSNQPSSYLTSNRIVLSQKTNTNLQIIIGNTASTSKPHLLDNIILNTTLNENDSNLIREELKKVKLCRLEKEGDDVVFCPAIYIPPDAYIVNNDTVELRIINNQTCGDHIRVCNSSLENYNALKDELNKLTSGL